MNKKYMIYPKDFPKSPLKIQTSGSIKEEADKLCIFNEI
jgi:hypothetical protein